MLSKRKLRNRSGGEATPSVSEEAPLKKSLRKHTEESEEQKERPTRSLRHREKLDSKESADIGETNKQRALEKRVRVKIKEQNDKDVESKNSKEDSCLEDNKRYETVVGPIKMSDRKSGDANMFGAKLLPVTIKISKNLIKPKVLEELRDATKRTTEPKTTDEDKDVPEENKTTNPEEKIIKLVESPAFDELDITSKIEILDTSKKKLEEIKRKSEEQNKKEKEDTPKEDKKSKNRKSEPPKAGRNEKEKAAKEESKMELAEASTSKKTDTVNSELIVEKNESKQEVEKAREEKWKEGEKILCFHGPLIYEAKIQREEIQNGIPKYFIHYHGWNKNWDEWVAEARMLKFTDRNVEIQKDLCRAHEAKERARKNKQKQDHVFAVPKTPSPVPKKESQGRRKSGLKPKKREDNQTDEFFVKNGKHVNLMPPDSTVESEEQFRTKLEIKIKIPEELKSYIVDDWNQICKKKKLCVLPAKITADQMINEYTRAKTLNKAEKMKNNKEKAILDVTAGVREYFNVMLSSQLLYKPERSQYEQLLRSEPNMVPCKTYGVVHLLRLFTKLGEMLIYTPLSEKSINLLLFYVNDMLMYMKRNASMIFSLADYTQDGPT